MLPLRRTALRALSARPTTFALLSSTPRTFVTCSPRTALITQQWGLSRFQKRFASDEAQPSESTVTDETVTEARSAEENAAAAEVAAAESDAEPAISESVTEPTSTSDPSAAAAAGAAVAGAATIRTIQGGRDVSYPGQPEHAIPSSNTLYVGNLFFEATEEDLRQLFEPYGAIENVRLAFDHRGLSKGFAHIEFKSEADAASAIEARNQEIFQGRRITVQFHRPRARRDLTQPTRPNPPTKTLFIGNMSFEMSDKDLNDLFRDIRNVIDVRVAIDRRSGQPRGFAHADFVDIASATTARELLANKEIYGRKLRVDYSVSSSVRR